MRRAFSALSFVSLLALAPACDSEDTVGDDFRTLSAMESTGESTETLEVGIQMTTADGGQDDGSVIWEVVEAEVFDGPAVDGNLLLFVENNAIFDQNGVQTCEVSSPYLNSSMREVVAANGSEVLFTVYGNYVFEGEINVYKMTPGKLKTLIKYQLLFEYVGTDIYLGEAFKDDYLLMSTNADLTTQSDGRKLLMAALIAGECGSAGLPGYNF